MAGADDRLGRLAKSVVDGAVLALVPSGEFLRGTPLDQAGELGKALGADIRWFRDEQPASNVHLPAFYVNVHPITNEQFGRFRKHQGLPAWQFSRRRGFDDPHQPVVGVPWEDAAAYSSWAGRRLPTEAEWEKAARGADGRVFPWGNDFRPEAANCANVRGGPSIVGSFPEGMSPYGVYDMAGNVYEWVSDWYQPEYYKVAPRRSPTGPTAGPSHVLRGGAWINVPTMVRCAKRDFMRPPPLDLKFVGFRTVVAAEIVASSGRYEILE